MCILTFELSPVDSNGQILWYADTRYRVPASLPRKKKKTQPSKMKTLHKRKHFLICKKKSFTTLPRKAGYPDHARARLRVADNL